MQRQYRNLAVLKEAGARVNLCMGPWTNREMMQPGSERWAVDLVEHLIHERGFDHVRWLTLFNEPDAIYAPPTALAEELARRGFGAGQPFSDYVQKHRDALTLLEGRELSETVRLVVGDAMWPPARRLEWLQLLRNEFDPAQVSFSFHHYAPDERSHDAYFDHPDSAPYRPPPLDQEIAGYREAVGPDAELICWEFNQPGWSMNSAAWLGCGPRGEDHLGTFETAAAHARKVITMLGHGVDGLSHWCVGDMFYRSGLTQGVMYCGLWRYKWESWVPRPVYFYYAALMQSFTPGIRVHGVQGLPPGVVGVAGVRDGVTTVALLTREATSLDLRPPHAGEVQRLRVNRQHLPQRPDMLSRETGREEMPLSDWQPCDVVNGTLRLSLEADELSLLRFHGVSTP